MNVHTIASAKCLYMQPIDYGNNLVHKCPVLTSVVTGCGHLRLAAIVDCSLKGVHLKRKFKYTEKVELQLAATLRWICV